MSSPALKAIDSDRRRLQAVPDNLNRQDDYEIMFPFLVSPHPVDLITLH
jgi:hypothetical protein